MLLSSIEVARTLLLRDKRDKLGWGSEGRSSLTGDRLLQLRAAPELAAFAAAAHSAVTAGWGVELLWCRLRVGLGWTAAAAEGGVGGLEASTAAAGTLCSW